MRLFNLIYFLFIFIGISIPREPSKDMMEEAYKRMAKYEKIQELKNSEFSVQNLMDYLTILEVPNKEIILRQAVIETGWFKSRLATKYNNLFGMMYHKSCRKTTATGVAYLYIVQYEDKTITYHPSKYNHWTDSVDDYLLFVEYHKNRGQDVSDYYGFLHRIGYAYEGNYIKILKKLDISKYLNKPSLTEKLS